MTNHSDFDFDALIAAIAKRGIAILDAWMGTLCVDLGDDVLLYATPGWEGLPGLPWSVETDGDVPAHGTVEIDWSDDLDENVATYAAALAKLVAAHS